MKHIFELLANERVTFAADKSSESLLQQSGVEMAQTQKQSQDLLINSAGTNPSVNNSFRSFFLGLVTAIGAGCLGTLALNFVFDPLWYFGGNKIGRVNYSFNERLSKAILYSKNPDQYDCIILGSSRTTLLNERKIKTYNCFNFSFAGGRIEEFIAYANWIEKQGRPPEKVIFAVEYENVHASESSQNPKNSVPKFILEGQKNPDFLRTYISLSSLKLSLKTLFRVDSRSRLYDASFTGIIEKKPPAYKPSIEGGNVEVRSDSIHDYEKLISIFPEADFVGYVPPLSPWKLASKSESEIETFLETAYSIATQSQAFYDFSIPNKVTKDINNTYDGSHYNLDITSEIADTFNSQLPAFGIRVDGMSKSEYFKAYRDRLTQFKSEIGYEN